MENKQEKNLETAIFGGGCFWCLEATFKMFRGVESVMPGYAGGEKVDPTYEEVSAGGTGHAETVKIMFDPSIISFETLLEIFFTMHDPTTRNRQGNDVGPQYRSIILYADDKQKEAAEKYIQKLEAEKIFADPIVTELAPIGEFYEAEEYHHDYYAKNQIAAYCQTIINPKVSKAREHFKKYLK